MPADARVPAGLLALVLGAACTTTAAFEPGTTRVCEPSADRSRFECREVKPGVPSTEAPRSVPSPAMAASAEPATPTPVPDEPAAIGPAEPATPAARSLPNYLLQDPASARASMPVAEPEPEPAVAPRPDAPVMPLATPAAVEAGIETGADDESGEAAPVASPDARALADPDAAPPAAEPVADEPLANEPVADETEPAANPAPIATIEATPPAPRIAAHTSAAGASAFRRLAGSRYTIEIARAQTPGELGALVAALAGIDGTLYLISLRTPEGSSHSLVWSDFPSIEDARDARTTLPTDVAITSGWPRRIGPLQAELIDP